VVYLLTVRPPNRSVSPQQSFAPLTRQRSETQEEKNRSPSGVRLLTWAAIEGFDLTVAPPGCAFASTIR
jgi:hypothetical protein